MYTYILLALLSTFDGVRLVWNTMPDAHYRVLAATSPTGPWITMTNILGSGGFTNLDLPKNKNQQFFQIMERTNPFSGKQLYVDPSSSAARQAQLWESARPDEAREMDKLAARPRATWINGPGDIQKIRQVFTRCGTNIPIFVLYYMYERDYQGGFSSGGAPSPLAYTNFINTCSLMLREKECIVVLEPDALASLDGLPIANQNTRLRLMSHAAEVLGKESLVHTYADAGHPQWKDAQTMAVRLRKMGIEKLRGFSLNVSNFILTKECIKYGSLLSSYLDYTHFVIDVSRNGKGPTPSYEWCNPPGRGLENQMVPATADHQQEPGFPSTHSGLREILRSKNRETPQRSLFFCMLYFLHELVFHCTSRYGPHGSLQFPRQNSY